MYRLPLSRPTLTGREGDHLATSLASGKLSGDGVYTGRVRTLLEGALGASVLLTTSGTTALELAALLMCGDAEGSGGQPEAIIPSFTFVSTANAFHLRGFRVVFADVDPNDGNLTPEAVERVLTAHTRVIVPVDYAGVPGDLDGLCALARDRGVALVEDAAQSLFTTRGGKQCGTFGDLGCVSFHETKNFQCGEGGALVVNKPELLQRAEILREKGTNRSQFLQGHVDRYTWVDVGSSFLPADLLAAVLLPQLEDRALITAKRRDAWRAYHDRLRPLEERGVLRLPHVPAEVSPNYHLFYVVLESLDVRTRLMKELNAQGIMAAFHYPALHATPMGRRIAGADVHLPHAEMLGDRLLRLPLFTDIATSDIDRVCAAVAAFFS